MTDSASTLVATEPHITRFAEHTVEIVSDAGEGAQKCGQIFGAVSAKMGNGVWTVEIIPAEISRRRGCRKGPAATGSGWARARSPTGVTRPIW